MVVAILAVYRLLLFLVLIGGAPYWLTRLALSSRYRAGLKRRLGIVPARLGLIDSRREIVWVHAVSVGEVLAATELVRSLSDAGCAVALSTTTKAGQELARKRFRQIVVFYMPLDLAWIVRRYLRALRPRLVVLMESELWPNLIHACKLRGVPLAVANARISDRSFPRYLRLRPLWKPLLREVSLFLAQSDETAQRLRQMGVRPEHLRVTGNLKYDVPKPEPTPLTHSLRPLLNAPLIVAGSTLAGEEELLLAAFTLVRKTLPETLLLLAPRHPQRFTEVIALLHNRAFPVVQCSRLTAVTEPIPPGAVLLLDTIGDLASLYALAAVAFVGGSLVAKGGHNPLEPALFGVPVLMGPSIENFREIVAALQAQQAIRLVQPDELGPALLALLQNPEEAEALGQRARHVFQAHAGATQRTLAPLLALMRGLD